MSGGARYSPFYTHRYVSTPDERRPSVHGSTLCELPNGDLLASWYGGSREMGQDVSILGSRLPRGAEKWEPYVEWAETPDHSMGNPVLFQEPDGARVWLFYVTIYGRHWREGKVHYRVSEDAGVTWGPEETLLDEIGQMTRNTVHVMPSGEWLVPMYDERDWTSYVLYSDDRGATWQRSNVIRAPAKLIQASIVPLTDGRLLALMRSGSGPGCGLIWRATSEDGGHTWSDATPTPLPNPNAGCDAVATPGGAIVLAFNNTPSGRSPLSVALSDDGGETWPHRRAVETSGHEYSYPALIQTSDGLFHLTYTYRRTHIKHVVFDEAWLRAARTGAP